MGWQPGRATPQRPSQVARRSRSRWAGLAAHGVRAQRGQRERASPLGTPAAPRVNGSTWGRAAPAFQAGDGLIRALTRARAVVTDGLTRCPVCSPQLLVYKSSSPFWPCATPSFPRRLVTTSSTRPPPQVRPLGPTGPAVPFSGDWGVFCHLWEMQRCSVPHKDPPCLPLASHSY